MSYPYGKRYIEQIWEHPDECKKIQTAYYTLCEKYAKDHEKDSFDLSLVERFTCLGEAFELMSDTIDGITDTYHFMWDVVEELLEKSK